MSAIDENLWVEYVGEVDQPSLIDLIARIEAERLATDELVAALAEVQPQPFVKWFPDTPQTLPTRKWTGGFDDVRAIADWVAKR